MCLTTFLGTVTTMTNEIDGDNPGSNDEKLGTPRTMTTRGKWYVVNTLSGHEQKARKGLLSRVTALGLEGRIYEVLIPTQQITEFNKGRKQTVERKLYPGYLLVCCELDDDTWMAIRNTPGISGFAGQNQRNQQPSALSSTEVLRIIGVGQEAPLPAGPTAAYANGETIRVIAGPFAGFLGNVIEVLIEQNRIKIALDIFGRETIVELDFEQVRRP